MSKIFGPVTPCSLVAGYVSDQHAAPKPYRIEIILPEHNHCIACQFYHAVDTYAALRADIAGNLAANPLVIAETFLLTQTAFVLNIQPAASKPSRE
jgi:hypothetical protein